MVTFDPIVDNEEHVKALNDSSLVKGNFKDYWEVAYDKERSGKGSTHTGAAAAVVTAAAAVTASPVAAASVAAPVAAAPSETDPLVVKIA